MRLACEFTPSKPEARTVTSCLAAVEYLRSGRHRHHGEVCCAARCTGNRSPGRLPARRQNESTSSPADSTSERGTTIFRELGKLARMARETGVDAPAQRGAIRL